MMKNDVRAGRPRHPVDPVNPFQADLLHWLEYSGLTYAQAARELHVSANSLGRWARGEFVPAPALRTFVHLEIQEKLPTVRKKT